MAQPYKALSAFIQGLNDDRYYKGFRYHLHERNNNVLIGNDDAHLTFPSTNDGFHHTVYNKERKVIYRGNHHVYTKISEVIEHVIYNKYIYWYSNYNYNEILQTLNYIKDHSINNVAYVLHKEVFS